MTVDEADTVIDQLRSVEAPDRLQEFKSSYAGDLCHVDYWRVVARMWRETAPDRRDTPDWTAMWERASIAPGAQLSLMDDAERAQLAALPERVAVWRGYAGEDWRGLTWTLDRRQAERMARDVGRAADPPGVVSAQVPRERIVALLRASEGGDDGAQLVVLPDGLEPTVERPSAP